jgi:hypothetical protein
MYVSCWTADASAFVEGFTVVLDVSDSSERLAREGKCAINGVGWPMVAAFAAGEEYYPKSIASRGREGETSGREGEKAATRGTTKAPRIW